MTIEECEAVLHACSKIEWPRALRHGNGDGDDLTPREKIETLEDFMLLCAEARNRCENGRIVVAESLRVVREEWEAIAGWESFLPGGKRRKDATKDDINEARRQIKPDLWPSIQTGEFLLRRFDQQISRFAQNEQSVSRLYTFATGG